MSQGYLVDRDGRASKFQAHDVQFTEDVPVGSDAIILVYQCYYFVN